MSVRFTASQSMNATLRTLPERPGGRPASSRTATTAGSAKQLETNRMSASALDPSSPICCDERCRSQPALQRSMSSGWTAMPKAVASGEGDPAQRSRLVLLRLGITTDHADDGSVGLQIERCQRRRPIPDQAPASDVRGAELTNNQRSIMAEHRLCSGWRDHHNHCASALLIRLIQKCLIPDLSPTQSSTYRSSRG